MDFESGLVVGAPQWQKCERTNAICKMGIEFAREGRAFLVTSPSQSCNWNFSEDVMKQLRGDRHLRRRLRIAFARSIEDVLSLLSGIDTWRKQMPYALFLDGLHEFNLLNEESRVMALLCAVFLESIRVCSKLLGKKCYMYISVDSDYYINHKEYMTALADYYFRGNIIHLQS